MPCLPGMPSGPLMLMTLLLGAWQAASDGFDWRGWASESAERAKEPFYGFTEFFKDVEADINRRQKKREAEPKSLYQELSDLGEEFVEWLEGGVGGSTPK